MNSFSEYVLFINIKTCFVGVWCINPHYQNPVKLTKLIPIVIPKLTTLESRNDTLFTGYIFNKWAWFFHFALVTKAAISLQISLHLI